MRTSLPWLVALTWLAFACGGPSEPAVSPQASGESDDSTVATGPDVGEASEPTGSDNDEPAAASSTPASDEEISAILQLVVDDPELDKHLNLGEPGRFPLQVSGDNLPSGLKLVKATEPVKVVGPPQSKKEPVLVLTEIDVRGDKATVRYRYDVEGIRGTVTLAKSPHGWELKNSRLVEH